MTSADGDTFAGTVKVKLGPIALVYNGSGTFVDKDDAAHRSRSTPRARTSAATARPARRCRCRWPTAPTAAPTSRCVTDLAITGKPAQFGRGRDAGRLRQAARPVRRLPRAAALRRPAASDPSPAAVAAADRPIADTPLADAAAAATPAAGRGGGGTPPRPVAAPRPAAPAQDDALDLGAAVLPVLVKGYWKQGVGGLAVLLVVWRLLRR